MRWFTRDFTCAPTSVLSQGQSSAWPCWNWHSRKTQQTRTPIYKFVDLHHCWKDYWPIYLRYFRILCSACPGIDRVSSNYFAYTPNMRPFIYLLGLDGHLDVSARAFGAVSDPNRKFISKLEGTYQNVQAEGNTASEHMFQAAWQAYCTKRRTFHHINRLIMYISALRVAGAPDGQSLEQTMALLDREGDETAMGGTQDGVGFIN